MFHTGQVPSEFSFTALAMSHPPERYRMEKDARVVARGRCAYSLAFLCFKTSREGIPVHTDRRIHPHTYTHTHTGVVYAPSSGASPQTATRWPGGVLTHSTENLTGTV